MHQRIQEHEATAIHRECASTLVSLNSKFNVVDLINKDFIQKNNESATKNRQVIERVVDVIKLIGN